MSRQSAFSRSPGTDNVNQMIPVGFNQNGTIDTNTICRSTYLQPDLYTYGPIPTWSAARQWKNFRSSLYNRSGQQPFNPITYYEGNLPPRP